MIQLSDMEYRLLRSYIRDHCGIDILPNKRYLFTTRLGEFLEREGLDSYGALYRRLTENGDTTLRRHLIQAITTHESSFFRDWHPFDVFMRKILPAVAAEHVARRSESTPIRILSCGCSAGQETYSIAVCVKEWCQTQTRFKPDGFSIVGVDIAEPVLEEARIGEYTKTGLGRFLPASYLRKYFNREGDKWRVEDDIRNMVRFTRLNLAERFVYVGPFDIIFCRNVIIYFPTEIKSQVLEQFHRLLPTWGYLIMGASESLIGMTPDFRAVHDGTTTYYVPIQKMP